MSPKTLRNASPYAALIATLSAAPVGAQETAAPAADAPPIQEVTVTARRREESLQDVPIAVSAFSAEQLDQIGAVDITTLQQTTPNLTLQVARGSNSTLIAFIRGVGQQDPLWGFEPGVGLYVDDVYVARPQGAVLDIYDIERIEVLRGPQGTLYGRNTIGGAIKYVTRRLGDDPSFSAKVNLGSYSQRDVIVTGSTPVGGGGLSVGATAAVYRRDGYGTNLTTGAEHYNKEVDAVRFTAEFAPNEAMFFRLAGDWLDDDSNAKHGHREAAGLGLAAGELSPADIYDTAGGIGDDNSVETQGISLLGEWQVSDALTFKSITAYREGETGTVIDFDMGPTPALDVPAFYEDDQLTQELQLLFDGGRVQGVAGLYYLDGSASGAFDTILGAANLTIATAGEVTTESFAAFADVSYDVTDALSVSAGGRWTSDKRAGTVYRQNFTGLRSPLFGNAAAVPGVLRSDYANERTFEEFTPRVSASFEFSDSLTAYTAYSEGFKSGGFDMRGDVVFTPDTVNGYDPEFVESTEVGLKGSLGNGRFTFNAAVFDADYEGQQITRQEPTSTGIASFVDNAASSEIKGVELESALHFTDDFSAAFGVGYIDAEFNEFNTFTVASGMAVPIDLSSTAVFQNTPEWNGNLTLTYRQELSGGRGSIVWTGVGSYRSEYSMFEFPSVIDQTEDYTLVDAGIIWTAGSERLSIGAHGRNLTDEEYRIGGYNFPGALFGNSINSFYGPPRTWYVSASYRFD
jgi:iron complex outermembrane recepter protein